MMTTESPPWSCTLTLKCGLYFQTSSRHKLAAFRFTLKSSFQNDDSYSSQALPRWLQNDLPALKLPSH